MRAVERLLILVVESYRGEVAIEGTVDRMLLERLKEVYRSKALHGK